MGVAHRPGRLAVAGQNRIYELKNAADIAPRLEPAGKYDACYLTRSASFTGEIQAHEMDFSGDELWVVNTLFSCLCTLSENYSFVPRWQPPFISALAAEDRCHLNGMAVVDDRVKYVTAMAQSDTPGGWRPDKVSSGCLIDVESNAIVAEGFAMPHSPRMHKGQLYVLDSGRGRLVRVDPADGQIEPVCELPGYTRGLAFCDRFAFVGLSKIRETSTFGGVPIAEDRESLKCGVAVVDPASGKLIATFQFTAGVDEIFDVTILPGVHTVALRGPFVAQDGEVAVWVVPEPGGYI